MQIKHPIRFAGLCIALGLSSHVAMAHGDFKCNEPSKEWRLREDLTDKLQADGWDVRKIKIDNGCYEVYGFDGKGKRREAYFNPKSLELIGDVPQK
jgi:hypothetical protein